MRHPELVSGIFGFQHEVKRRIHEVHEVFLDFCGGQLGAERFVLLCGLRIKII